MMDVNDLTDRDIEIARLRTERDAARAEIEKAHDVLCLLPEEADLVTACRYAMENVVEGDRKLATAQAEIDVYKQALANESDWKKELYAQLDEVRGGIRAVGQAACADQRARKLQGHLAVPACAWVRLHRPHVRIGT